MYPIILEIGSFSIHTYGVMLALSFILGIMLAEKRAKKMNINPDIISNLSILILVSSVVGSRGMYVLTHLYEFKGHWMDAVAFWKGLSGLTVLGGFVLAVLLSIIYLVKKKISIWPIADIVMPIIGFGEFLTRIGCFFNGCCFGKPTNSFLGVIFPEGSYPVQCYHSAIPIHPTQLYSSFYGLAIFVLMILIEKKKPFVGFNFFFFFLLYGLSRFIVDFFRFYTADQLLLGITNNQWISLLMTVSGIIGYFIMHDYCKRNNCLISTLTKQDSKKGVENNM